MVQKSGDHQLRLVVYLIIYAGLFTSQVVQDLFHQQYLTGEFELDAAKIW